MSIANVIAKEGRSGDLMFVTVRQEITNKDGILLWMIGHKFIEGRQLRDRL